MSDVFCYVAHKGGYWAGVTFPGKDAGRFLAEFVNDGFSISTCATREAYTALLDTLEHWHRSPEYRAKRARKSAQTSLFNEERR